VVILPDTRPGQFGASRRSGVVIISSFALAARLFWADNRKVIKKPEQHDIDVAGQRLLKESLEPLGWRVNPIEKDYGFDFDVQVFSDESPSGIWFKIQLKSSRATKYSSDKRFLSESLQTDHARHYALELNDPVFLIHADVMARRLLWHAPQLDKALIEKLASEDCPKEITLRILTERQLPTTAGELLRTLKRLYLLLGARQLVDSSVSEFAESLSYHRDAKRLREEFQLKHDTLKLLTIHDLYRERRFREARERAGLIIIDPDAQVESKFSAQLEIIEVNWLESIEANRPQSELPSIRLKGSRDLQKLTKCGPGPLKFFALIATKAAELEVLARHDYGLVLTKQMHSKGGYSLALMNLLAAQAISTKRVIAKYDQCVRLARYAANYQGRWALPNALMRIVFSIAGYVASLRFNGFDDLARAFEGSTLQICKLMAWIAEESGNQDELASSITAALLTVQSNESEAFKFACQILDRIVEPEAKKHATTMMESVVTRWTGGTVATDYRGDPVKQIVEHMAASLGIDPSDEANPIVKGLYIAARDDDPTRVLRTCEYLVVSLGAMGATAQKIKALFNIDKAGHKVVHCALHRFHQEGGNLDAAYSNFKASHCDSCKDKRPRPDDWKCDEAFLEEDSHKNWNLVTDFNATGKGFRYAEDD